MTVSVSPAKPRPRLTRLLLEDPDLAECVPREHRRATAEHLIASVISVPRGRWHVERFELSPGGIGLLVLEGMLLRSVGVDGRFGSELLGEGDLIRPWHGEDGGETLQHTTGWRVIEKARVGGHRRCPHAPPLPVP